MQEVAAKIGRAVAALHDGGIVHGDLTTSNMITRDGDGALVRCVLPLTRDAAASLRDVGSGVHSRTFAVIMVSCLCQVLIDFGLSYNTSLAEDKAVDLYVLERAITSAHSHYSGLVRGAGTRAQRSSKC